MPVIKKCLHCEKEFSVIPAKKDSAKYCSKKCKWEYNGWSSEPNTTCKQCGKEFHLKPFRKKRLERSHGYFCSNLCVGVFRSSGVYDGNKNPNYRGRTQDCDVRNNEAKNLAVLCISDHKWLH